MFSFAAGIMLVEIVWLVLGVTWLTYHYRDCPIEGAKEAVMGKEQHNSLRGGTCIVVWLELLKPATDADYVFTCQYVF
jgi:hypothetical protein